MPWTSEPPVVRIVSTLLMSRVRAERLALIRKIQFAEAQAAAAGFTVAALKAVREQLSKQALSQVEPTFEVAPVPVRPRSAAPRHLAVRARKGSKF